MEIVHRQAALCIFLRDGAFLVSELIDGRTGAILHRPPGGGIEPGETPEQAVRREVLEELEITLSEIDLLGSVDHVWWHKGRENHERTFLFLGKAGDDPRLERGETIELIEADGDRIRTVWREIHAKGAPPLCPEALFPMLANLQEDP